MALTMTKPTDLTMDVLAGLGRAELLDLFRALPAPTPAEMNGEFLSGLPEYMSALWRETMEQRGVGYWLGKSYTPSRHHGHMGHGLNRYRTATGKVDRRSRFVWDIEPSVVDRNPSLVMRYAAFDNWGGGHDLIDEVRRAAPGVYLGLYHTAKPVPGFTPREGGERSAWEFFMLEGPVAAFVPADVDEALALPK